MFTYWTILCILSIKFMWNHCSGRWSMIPIQIIYCEVEMKNGSDFMIEEFCEVDFVFVQLFI